nr:probable sodium/metabolite cotransporter BASS1, chloroplastic [Tanacetum cinerariifolium]
MVHMLQVMPLSALFISRLLNLPSYYAAGLILVGCCPGGTASNIVTYIARGNAALSVLMTAASTLSAVVGYDSNAHRQIGWPICCSRCYWTSYVHTAGAFMNQYLKGVVKFVAPLMPPFAVATVAILCGNAIAQSSSAILMSGQEVVLAAVLHISGFFFGYALSRTLGVDASSSKTISIEVGMQNSVLGVVLATQHFGNPLTAVPCAVSSVCHSILGSALAGEKSIGFVSKEQKTWSLKFIEEKDEDSQSGDETDDEKENDNENLMNDYENDNDLEENELDHVSESSCMHDHNHHASKRSEHPINSDDPFEIYKILEKNNDKGGVEKNKGTMEVENLLDSNEDVASVTSGIKSFKAPKSGGSLLDVINELIKVGHAMGYNMDGCMKNIETIIGSQGDRQETKMERIDIFSIKALWGNLSFDYVCSPYVGYYGGILCVWDPSLFLKDNSTISDSFVAIKGDVNEVCSIHERYGTVFNYLGAISFNNFITMAGLVDLLLEGYSYTWSHKSAFKMSKLDRFLISKGLLTLFPSLSALCLDRHLSDHRPIIMRELNVNYVTTPFHFFHSWFNKNGFDKMVEDSWNSSLSIHNRLSALDKLIDQGKCSEDLVSERSNLLKELHDLNSNASVDMIQKAKIRWAIEGDENPKYFHGIINKKRSQLAIRGVLVQGDWIVEPSHVKKEFLNHFSNRFADPNSPRLIIDFQFPNTLSLEQLSDIERDVTYDEIKNAVWDCENNKSHGPDGFTFEFFQRYWKLIDDDVVAAVLQFFSSADKAILSGANNRPPMLDKDMYDSWKSRMELYMLNRQHGRMILESVENG